jgi:hypothetical protein
MGRDILELINETKQPGEYEIELDGRNLAGGMYFYKLQTENYTETKKLILLK